MRFKNLKIRRKIALIIVVALVLQATVITYLENENIKGFTKNATASEGLGEPVQDMYEFAEALINENPYIFSIGIGDEAGNYNRTF